MNVLYALLPLLGLSFRELRVTRHQNGPSTRHMWRFVPVRFLTHTVHAAGTGRRGALTAQAILDAPSSPVTSPSYPRGPYNFYNREYFIVPFETTPEAIR